DWSSDVCSSDLRLDAAVVVAGAGVDDDGDPQGPALQGAQHLEAVHAWHLEVEDDAVHRLALQDVERLAATPGGQRLIPAHALQVVGVLLGEDGDIVDDEHRGHTVARLKPRLGDCG